MEGNLQGQEFVMKVYDTGNTITEAHLLLNHHFIRKEQLFPRRSKIHNFSNQILFYYSETVCSLKIH